MTIVKYAIFLAIPLILAAFFTWAFLPARYLPGNRARHLRIRLHLRLHPGKGFAHLFSLHLRWGRLAALRRSSRIRPDLPLRYRLLDCRPRRLSRLRTLKKTRHPTGSKTTIPPMTERKDNLPSRYDRLDDQITGPVVDAIVISPRSCGTVYMPGEHSADKRPPGLTGSRSPALTRTTRASTTIRSSAAAPSATTSATTSGTTGTATASLASS